MLPRKVDYLIDHSIPLCEHVGLCKYNSIVCSFFTSIKRTGWLTGIKITNSHQLAHQKPSTLSSSFLEMDQYPRLFCSPCNSWKCRYNLSSRLRDHQWDITTAPEFTAAIPAPQNAPRIAIFTDQYSVHQFDMYKYIGECLSLRDGSL